MKILIVSQYFWPENFRINDLALELKLRGHEVTVLTGKPNYPEGYFYDGYGYFSKSQELFKDILVHRVPMLPRKNGKGIHLALNYISFAFFSSIFALFHRKKYDASFVFAISPITMVFPAIVHKKCYGTKLGLWVQDLWPESVSAAGKFNSKFVHKILTQMVKYIYKQSDKIFISSKGFAPSVLAKYNDETKIHYLPNWAEDVFLSNDIDRNKYSKDIPDGFIIMFAGNIGESQDIDNILKAMLETQDDKSIKWIIVGSGRKKTWLEEQIQKHNLSDTVILLGRYPLEEMPNLYVQADMLLVSLKNEEIFNLTIPAKTQSYMAFGKPIAAMLNGEGASVIQDAKCGFAVAAGDYLSLVQKICTIKSLGRNVLQKMGENSKIFYEANFSKDIIIADLLSNLQHL